MSSAIDAAILPEKAQATVEAAFALPILMLLFLLLLQPGIILYDRIVMSNAAAEGCRLLATTRAGDEGVCEDFVRRRLSAIPQVDQFHIHGGGCSYDIRMDGNESSGEVSVSVSNKVRPLPLLDAGFVLAGLSDGSGCLTVSVRSSMKTQPDWLESSPDGRDPSSWAVSS